ncbi:protein dachsous-like [Haliotis rufescens]|uniref:protein dachsous-like n=1 Tax=Haliotis rufescens TaxID=6454 RepID=UPI00201F2846|nr:protein dachsous-like [Haliotis rufescens]
MQLKKRVDIESNTTKTLLDSLMVSVKDSAAKKKEANITIKFIDVNDNVPEFDQTLISANATENSTKNVLVTQLTYSDLDRGPNGNVTLQISSTSPLFRLEGDKLYVDGTQLDYEDGIPDHQHAVTIQAVDHPQSGQAKTGQAVVVVKIISHNEHVPVWSSPDIDSGGNFPNKSLFGVDTPLAEVGTFIATDQDGGEDGHLVYSLTSAVTENGENVTGAFTVNPVSGVLLTTVHVDSGARTPSSYFDVVVVAADRGTPPKTAEGKIRVIIDVTQTVSKLIKTARFVSQFVAKVAEDASVGDVVKNFTGAFPAAEKTEYKVTGKWNDTFEFDGLNLKLMKKLDYEDTRIHFVDIRISDGSKDETTVMAVSVNDVPDEAPKIEVLSSSVPEELPPASVVGRLFRVTDGDDNDTLTYQLTGDHAKYFDINAETGILTMKETLNRDGKDGVHLLDQLTLTVTDRAGLTTNSTLNLTVLDMNDNTPTLGNGGVNLNITENSTSDTVLTSLTCEDPDEGQNGNCSIQLKTELTNIFKMKGSDLTADGTVIDYEGLSNQQFGYKLTVLTTDHPDGGPPRTASITVDIQPSSRPQPPRGVCSLRNKSMPDMVNFCYVANQTIFRSLLTYVPEMKQFQIDLLFSAVLEAVGMREFCPNHATILKWTVALVVFGTIRAGVFKELKTDGTGNLNMVNLLGVPISGTDRLLFEAKGKGRAFIVLSESNKFNPKKGRYYCINLAFTSNDGKQRNNGIKYGCISCSTFHKSGLGTSIVEDKFSPLWISWTDGRIKVGDGTDIHNTPPVFAAPLPTGSTLIDVHEDSPADKTLLHFLCEDNEGDNITYSLKSHGDLFHINNASLILTRPLDYEKERRYTIKIEAFDGLYTVPVTLSVNVIDVNDETPVLTFGDDLGIPEEMPIGSILGGLFKAVDADPNDNLTYILQGDGASYFNFTNNVLRIIDHIDRDLPRGPHGFPNLTFIVKDSGSHEAKSVRSLKVLDINDNYPCFEKNIYHLNVGENSSSHTLLTRIRTFDADEGPNGNVSLTLKTGDDLKDLFHLEGINLYADGDKMDFETLGEANSILRFSVEGSDAPSLGDAKTSTASIYVSIVSKNEYSPTWTSPEMKDKDNFKGISVPENISFFSEVALFTASDEDVGVDGYVRDAAGMDTLTLVVEAADTGTKPTTVTGTLVLKIENINDNVPRFEKTLEDLELSTDKPPGSSLATIIAEDVDNDTISYSILGRDKDLFEYLDSKLKTKNKLSKRKSYLIELRASDGVHVASCAVSIHGDETESPNKSDMVSVSAKSDVKIPEEIPAGLPVPSLFVVMATDSAKNISYSLTGDDSHFFSIHRDTGEMSVKERIDADNRTRLLLDKLTVQVDTGGGVVKTADLTVTIEDINDNMPLFEQTFYTVNVTENSTSISLVNLTCSDADRGGNGNITMYITDGDKSLFNIDGHNLIVDGTTVDYDTDGDSSYTITVHAVDSPSAGQPRTGATVILVKVLPRNEFIPSWKLSNGSMATSRSDIHLAKNTDVGTMVSVITATDQDLGDDGKVSYFLDNVTSDAGSITRGIFSVTQDTGILKTESSFLDASFKDVKYFTLELRAADSGQPPKNVQTFMKIFIDPQKVDAGPTFSESVYTLKTVENTTTGFPLLNLSITWSGGDNHTLEIEEQVALNQSERIFGFENESLVLLKKLDYEKTRVHLLTVRATDGRGSSMTRILLQVEDVIDEAPVITVKEHNSLPEELPLMTIIGSLFSVTDADVNDKLHYSLIGSDSGYFAIQRTTGLLAVYRAMNADGPKGIKMLDNITLVVTDSGGLTTTANLSIRITNVNDNSPSLGKASFYVGIKENSPKDTELLSLNVSDADIPHSNISNFNIVFGSGNELGIFSVDGNVITVNGELIDCESTTNTKTQYVLPILVQDSDPYGRPRVIPVNEFTPFWLLPFNSSEKIYLNKTLLDSDDIGTIVTSVEATDEDWGNDGIVQYEILSVVDDSGNDANELFRISARTGTLLLANVLLGVASGTTYNITFQARDRGDPFRSIQGEMKVYIESSNRPPRFLQDLYQFDISEDSPLHQPLLNLTVYDLENANLTFNITDNGKEFFSFAGANLVLVSRLDFEDKDTHTITVRVSDGEKSDDTTLLIRVLNVFDEPPRLSGTNASLNEELPHGSLTAKFFVVTDGDIDDRHNYTLEGDDAHFFSIDEASGVMRMRERLDYDGPTGRKYLDNVTVTVTDLGGHNSSTQIYITVVGVNDNPPSFDKVIYETEFTENSESGSHILSVNISDVDDDTSGNISTTIVKGNDLNIFLLNKTELYANTESVDLDNGTVDGNPIMVVVMATETTASGRSLSSTAVVMVRVLSKNEFSPEVTSPALTNGTFQDLLIPLSTSVGGYITQIQGTDEDSGTDGQMEYQIVSIQPDSENTSRGLFNINSDTGVITLAESLSGVKNKTDFLNITIRVSDKGDPAKYVEGVMTLNFQNAANEAPVFAKKIAMARISEDQPVGSVVANLTVADPEGDPLTLSVARPWDVYFSMNGFQVVLNTSLDAETSRAFMITVQATDGKNNDTTTVMVKVLDVYDTPPQVIVQGLLEVLEELPVGASLGQLFSVTDADLNDSFTFSLHGNDSQYFEIDTVSGAVKMKTRLDYEGGYSIHRLDDLKVTVTDKGGNSTSAYLNITVLDVNDNPPTCSMSVYEVEVQENTEYNASLLTLMCHDADAGDNETLTARILGLDSNVSYHLRNLRLFANMSDTDYESLSAKEREIFLDVEVTDRPNRTDYKILPKNEFVPEWILPTPDENNTFPSISAPQDAAVGTVLIQMKVKDADLGPDGDIQYSIESVHTDAGINASGMFSLDEVTGLLRLEKSLLSKEQNASNIEFYFLTVTASDKGVQPNSITGNLKLIVQHKGNQPPSFDRTVYRCSVAESMKVGDKLVDVNVTDPEGEHVNVSLTGPYSDVFGFNGTELRLKQKLDFEQNSKYVVEINASDGEMEVTSVVYISVENDYDEFPSIHLVSDIEMVEELPIGTALNDWFSVKDMDVDDNHTYSLSGNDSWFLTIDQSSGEISVANLIDYDGADGIIMLRNVTLTVRDNGGNEADATFNVTVVNINDNTPSCSEKVYSINVTEDTSYNSTIFTLDCTDLDNIDETNFTTLILGSERNSSAFRVKSLDLFLVDETLDYESGDKQYMLTIELHDIPENGQPKTSFVIVVVEILSKNEFSPMWVSPLPNTNETSFPSIHIPHDTAVGSPLLTFTVKDDDDGLDGELTFGVSSIFTDSGNNITGLFTIDDVSGNLQLNHKLSSIPQARNANFFNLIIVASDKGNPPKSVEDNIKVFVKRVGNRPPEIEQTFYSLRVMEDALPGSVLHRINASDAEDDNLTLSLVQMDSGKFLLDYDELKLVEKLDYEDQKLFVFQVSASDGKHETLATVSVEVLDINDEDPVILTKDPLEIPEEIPPGTVVHLFTVEDTDFNDSLTLVLNGNDSQYFDINPTSLEIRIRKAVDFDGDNGRHFLDDLTLTVVDKGGNTANVTFNVTISNINDNAPICSDTLYTVNITENTPTNDSIFTLDCQDIDDNTTNLTSEIKDGNHYTMFKTNGLSLYLDREIDFEQCCVHQQPFLLAVLVTDQQNGSRGRVNTATVLVHVLIQPSNEYEPEWSSPKPDINGSFPDLHISQNAPVGTVLISFKVKDDDAGDDGIIKFNVISTTSDTGENTTGLFTVDDSTGNLAIMRNLVAEKDSEHVQYYDIEVQASDRGSVKKSVQGQIRVRLKHINNQPPVFAETVYRVEVGEDTDIGDVILNVTASDPEGKNLTLDVVKTNADYFKFEDLALTLQKSLDFEMKKFFAIEVKAFDGEQDASASVYVTVTNVYDETPEITLESTQLQEGLSAGAALHRLFHVGDRDIDDVVNYTLSGNDSVYFDIDELTGAMFMRTAIDYDGPNGTRVINDLILSVVDKGGNTANVSVGINVTNVNDNPPLCSQDVYRANVTENTTYDEPILTLLCTDEDENTFNFTTHIHGMIPNATFRLVGLELFADGSNIDLESLEPEDTHFLLIATVADGDGENSLTATVMIDVQILSKNEFSPVWKYPESTNGTFPPVSVPQDARTDTVISMFQATDQDTGTDGHVTYTLGTVSKDNGDNITGLFEIHPQTGNLYLKESMLKQKGIQDIKYYDIQILARDNGFPQEEIQGVIQVKVKHSNNQPPYIEKTVYSVSVSESAGVGTVVVNITATDPDGGNVTLSKTGKDEGVFQFDGLGLVTKTVLDFEKRSYYILQASASDGESDASFIVHVSVENLYDEVPVITLSDVRGIREEMPVGSIISDIFNVKDRDRGDNLNYSLTGNDSAYFDIDVSSGEMAIKRLINYDESSGLHEFVDLVLIVTDKGGNSANASLNITVTDINDNSPVCTQALYRINVTENRNYEHPLLRLTCSDSDSDDVNLTTTLKGAPDNITFTVSGTELYVEGDSIDFEALKEGASSYILTILLEDRPGSVDCQSTNVMIYVQVLSKNEFAPVWKIPKPDNGTFPHVTVPQDARTDTVISMFQATDQDTGTDGHVTYTLGAVSKDNGDNITGLFEIHPQTGNLYLKESMLKQKGIQDIKYYDIQILARDNGFPQEKIQGVIKVKVKHSNNQPPYIEKTVYSVSVAESAGVGTVVVNITATDPDGGNVTLSRTGKDEGVFQFDGLGLVTKAVLDYEKRSFYILQASASDGENDVSFIIHVSVENLYDEVPVITLSDVREIREEIPVGSVISGIFNVKDRDRGDYLTYTLMGNDSTYFDINVSSGEMVVKSLINHDGRSGVRELHDLVLVVTDKGGNSANTSLNITITDINDNAPVCTQALYRINVTENTTYDHPLLSLTCSDSDSDDVNLTTTLKGAPDNITFTVSGTELYVEGNSIDFEALEEGASSYILTILLEDRPGREDCQSTNVMIYVQTLSKNEFSPVWKYPESDNGTFPPVTVPQDARTETVISMFQATDQDTGTDGHVTYTLGTVSKGM